MKEREIYIYKEKKIKHLIAISMKEQSQHGTFKNKFIIFRIHYLGKNNNNNKTLNKHKERSEYIHNPMDMHGK